MFSCLKEEMTKSLRNKIGALLLKPAMRNLKHKMDPSAVGGTPLLGIDGAVVKAVSYTHLTNDRKDVGI